jgi:hypothetical protein
VTQTCELKRTKKAIEKALGLDITVTIQDRRLRQDIGHVRRGKMNPFGVFAKLVNKGVRSKDVVPFQGAGEVLDAMPTEEQLRELGNLPTEQELTERGFDPSTFYHGSPVKNIDEFVPQASDRTVFGGFRDKRVGEPVTFFSQDPRYVEGFALKGGMPVNKGGLTYYMPHESSRIYPVKIKMNNVYDYKNPQHQEMLEQQLGESLDMDVKIGDAFVLQDPKISKAIKDLGFEGFLTNETARFGNKTVGLFYPEKGNVRSVFAQFDPEKSDKGNIYASIIPPMATAVGVGALAGLEEST